MHTATPAPSNGQNHETPDEPATGHGTPAFDIERYLHHLAHLDMPLENKRMLVGMVAQIMQNFVDRAFGDDPAQLARKDGDENQLARETRRSGVIASKDHNNSGDKALTGAFMKRAGRPNRKEKP